RWRMIAHDIYAETNPAWVGYVLVAFLRGEMKFDGLDALKVQIDADAAAARALLG
ncbi:hypothetical protein LTR94_030299, partial [Friedmanniomyces endolithicus]